MPNHVHLILTPEDGEGLALALSRTHRLYAGFVNARARQTGHLFQGRFGSVAMDEDHLMVAARYVALNPVRAGLAPRAEDWPCSSVRAHLAGRDDPLVRSSRCSTARRVSPTSSKANRTRPPSLRFSRAELIGRPLGSPGFLQDIDNRLGRVVTPGKRGRKPRKEGAAGENKRE